MKQKFLLISAIAIGLLAALLARAWLDAKNGEVEATKRKFLEGQRTVKVLAVRHALPEGAVIKQEDLASLNTLEKVTTSDNISANDTISVVGRRLVHTVEAGAPLLWTYIDGGAGAAHTLSAEVQSGLRAVSIPVSGPSAVSGLVRPNDHVDVLGSFTLPDSTNPEMGKVVTMTVLQNVTVLATGTETARSTSATRPNSASGYSAVTLLVTPREAEVLVFSQQMKGRLALSLRNPNDVYYEDDLPQVDFDKIEEELTRLNEYRQTTLRRAPRKANR